jgi:hypothetical protein
VYGREYRGKTLHFEPSGGLLHASLVMQDKETDSYWAIMEGVSLAGSMQGEPLRELPLGEKVQWRQWVRQHPKTLVLSVEGEEHVASNPYDNYFKDDKGFRGVEAEDERLPTKAPVYAFERDGQKYAVPFSAFEGGAALAVEGAGQVFLYRPAGVEIFYSTAAFVSTAGFVLREGRWMEEATGATFDPERETFQGGEGAVERLDGFDTFWFNWSMNNPDTAVLTGKPTAAKG